MILQTDLNITETFIGMVLALHLNRKTGTIRIKQSLLAQECKCTDRMVRKAIKRLVGAGIFNSRRTGRSAILTPAQPTPGIYSGIVDRNAGSALIGTGVPITGNKTGRVEVTPVSHQTCHPCHIGDGKMPWEHDLTHSTRVEEEHKRPIFNNG